MYRQPSPRADYDIRVGSLIRNVERNDVGIVLSVEQEHVIVHFGYRGEIWPIKDVVPWHLGDPPPWWANYDMISITCLYTLAKYPPRRR